MWCGRAAPGAGAGAGKPNLYLLGDSDYRQALRCVEESLALYRQTDDPEGMGGALFWRGSLALSHDLDPRQALAYAEMSREQFMRAGSSFDIALTLMCMGYCLIALGETERAATVCEECYWIWEQTHHLGHTADALGVLYRANLHRGLQLYDHALGKLREAGDRQDLIIVLGNPAIALLGEGDNERGAAMLRECMELLGQTNEQGLKVETSFLGKTLGLAEYRLGHIDAAIRHNEESLRVSREIGINADDLAKYHYF